MEDVLVPMMAIGGIFIGLPWLVLHYVTKWKTAATLTVQSLVTMGLSTCKRGEYATPPEKVYT